MFIRSLPGLKLCYSLRTGPRYSSRYKYFRLLRNLLLLIIFFDLGFFVFDNTYWSTTYSKLKQPLLSLELSPTSLTSEQLAAIGTVFITSTLWNAEPVFPDFSRSLLETIDVLGRKNVFVSISESGSWDNTKNELKKLDEELLKREVRRKIVMEETTHKDEIRRLRKGKLVDDEAWISVEVMKKDEETGVKVEKEMKELRRIPFLAKQRNKAIQPLLELASSPELNSNITTMAIPMKFSKILFLNDIIFTPSDIIALLLTNSGIYAAACGLDFKTPPFFYDTFAVRDYSGRESRSARWPFFWWGRSLAAVMKGDGRPIPVKSCWNGVVAMDAQPFYSHINDNPELSAQLSPSSEKLNTDLVATSAPIQGIIFRALPKSLAQSHLEASECCLIHLDNPLSSSLGVYINPAVRITYSQHAYREIHPIELLSSPSSPSQVTTPTAPILADGTQGPTDIKFTFLAYLQTRGSFILEYFAGGAELWIGGLGKRMRMKNRVKRWIEEEVERWRDTRGGTEEEEGLNGSGINEEDILRQKLWEKAGVECLVDEAQVLREKGWAHLWW